MKKTIRYIGGIVTAAALAAAAAWWLSLPAPEDQHRYMAMIEQQRCAQLSVGTLSMPLISNIDDRDTTQPYRNFDTWSHLIYHFILQPFLSLSVSAITHMRFTPVLGSESITCPTNGMPVVSVPPRRQEKTFMRPPSTATGVS